MMEGMVRENGKEEYKNKADIGLRICEMLE